MKKIIIVFTFVIIGIALWFFLGDRKYPAQQEAEPTKRERAGEPALVDREMIADRNREQEERRKVETAELIRQANVPIDFWGKVVDQEGIPLEGVKITYRIQQPRVPWDTNSIVKTISTDSNGVFHVKNKGSTFGIEDFEKDGYRSTKGQDTSFTYSDNSEQYVPDKNSPKIYTLVREETIQTLISVSRQLLLDWDGKPLYYDLRTGKFGQRGELKITAKRGAVEGSGQQARYDWSFEIEVPGGGIVETTRERAFLAPVEGYQTSWRFGFLSSDPEWALRRQGDIFFFLKLPNGNYGKLQLDLNSEPGSRLSGRINSFLNPAGGRVILSSSRENSREPQ